MNVYLDGAEKLKKKANEDTVKKNNPYLRLFPYNEHQM